MHTNPTDPSVFYLSGRYKGKAAVIQIQKHSGDINWQTSFQNVTNIRAIASDTNYFYGCGDSFDNEDQSGVDDPEVNATYAASIFKMDYRGSLQWVQRISGSNGIKPSKDRCYGITTDQSTITVLLQVKARQLRSSLYGDFYDLLILNLSTGGNFIDSFSISNGIAVGQGYDMFVAGNGLVSGPNNAVFFAGWSSGFKTTYQTKSTNKSDAFLYYFSRDRTQWNGCLRNITINSTSFQ